MTLKHKVKRRIRGYSYRKKNRLVRVNKHRQSYWTKGKRLRSAKRESAQEIALRIQERNQKSQGLVQALSGLASIAGIMDQKEKIESAEKKNKQALAMQRKSIDMAKENEIKYNLKHNYEMYGVARADRLNVNRLSKRELEMLDKATGEEDFKNILKDINQSHKSTIEEDLFNQRTKSIENILKNEYNIKDFQLNRIGNSRTLEVQLPEEYKKWKNNPEFVEMAKDLKAVQDIQIRLKAGKTTPLDFSVPEPKKVEDTLSNLTPSYNPTKKQKLDREWQILEYLIRQDKVRTGRYPSEQSVQAVIDRYRGSKKYLGSIEGLPAILFKNTPRGQSFFGDGPTVLSRRTTILEKMVDGSQTPQGNKTNVQELINKIKNKNK